MPSAVGMKNGIATPTAIITEPMATMILRLCSLSEIGPETTEQIMSTTIEISDMVASVEAASSTLSPQYFLRMYSW